MTLVVTGRTVLGVLNAEDGKTTVDALQAKLGAEQVALVRVIRSLSAARLIATEDVGGNPHTVTLTDAGRKWCAGEFSGAAKPGQQAAPAQPTPSEAKMLEIKTPRLSEPPARSMDLRSKPQPRHGDRMRGVDVVRVSRRQRTLNPPAKPEAERSAEATVLAPPVVSVAPPLPIPIPKPAAMPAPLPVPAAKPPVPAERQLPEASERPVPLKDSEESVPVRYTVDQDGFVTHINGRKIF